MRHRTTTTLWTGFALFLVLILGLAPSTARADSAVTLTNGATPVVVAQGGLLSQPYGLAFSPHGDLYVSNVTGNSVTKIVLTSGVLSTFASGFPGNMGLRGLAFDPSGNIYGSDFATETIEMISPQGVLSQYADYTTAGNRPMGLTYDQGNLYSAAWGNGAVYRVGSGVLVDTGSNCIEGLTHDVAGNLYLTNGSNGTVYKITAQGNKSVFATGIANPVGIAIDIQGNLYVSSLDTGVISKITSSGTVSTFASGFTHPAGLVVFDGNLFVADSGTNSIAKLPLQRASLSPSHVRAIPGNHSATISWDPAPIDPRELFVPPVFTVDLIIHSFNGYWHGGPSCTTSSTTCTVSGLTNGQKYWVNVTETNASGSTEAFHATSLTPVSITITVATVTSTTAPTTTSTLPSPVHATKHQSSWLVYLAALLITALFLFIVYTRRSRR